MIRKMLLEFKVELESPVLVAKTVERHVALTAMLPEDIPGVIDEYSFRMEETTGMVNKPIAVQFTSDIHELIPKGTPSVRPPKPAPPNGTIPKAFPTALHYSCFEQGRELAVCSGVFTWFMQPGDAKVRTFVLYFDVLQEGEFMQLAPEPHNFIVFYPDKRIPQRAQHPSVEILPHITPDHKVHTRIDHELFATYNYSKEYDKPYFYPVIGPSGIEMTTVGKPHDPADSHKHHKSFWIAHQRVGDVNFWEEWPGNGKIVHQGFNALVTGPLFGYIEERNTWERGGRVHAYETRSFKTYKTGGDFTIVDVQITMEPERNGRFAGDLVIGSTIWGFLAFRLKECATPLDGGGEIRDSRGRLNEEEVIWESAEWCDISGPVTAGEWNGAAIFDNPENWSYPTNWQCRNDGFICTSFTGRGDYIVKMNEKLVVKHRVFIHKGNAIDGRVANAFADYISKYSVTIGDLK